MASLSKEKLRHRRAEPMSLRDKEVEITELSEEEGDEEAEESEGRVGLEEEEDPMVVKGSRPKAGDTPREPADGEEDYWGMDDEDEWHGKSKPGSDTTTTLRQKRQIMRRTGSEMLLAFLVHFVTLAYYIYVHVYDNTVYKKHREWFVGSEKFGGRWKYLTYLNLWLQFIYFFMAFLDDIIPRSYAKYLLHKTCDYIYTTLVFPMGIFVVITFWGIYAIDQELIFPARIAEHLPPLLNHHWHTFIGVFLLLEHFLVFHRYPAIANAAIMVFIVCTAYIIWIVTVLAVADVWVYPFLKAMPPPLVSVFFAACYFLSLFLYYIGKKLAYWRWQERFQVIEGARH